MYTHPGHTHLGILRMLAIVEVLLQLASVNDVQVVRDWLARPRDSALEWRQLSYSHDGADV